jgi:hypothetical protein
VSTHWYLRPLIRNILTLFGYIHADWLAYANMCTYRHDSGLVRTHLNSRIWGECSLISTTIHSESIDTWRDVGTSVPAGIFVLTHVRTGVILDSSGLGEWNIGWVPSNCYTPSFGRYCHVSSARVLYRWVTMRSGCDLWHSGPSAQTALWCVTCTWKCAQVPENLP